MTQTATAAPSRADGWKRPPLPRKKPLTGKKLERALSLLGRGYAAEVAPTGDENVRLMADVLSYATWEEAVATDDDPSRFKMSDWIIADGRLTIEKQDDGTPPPLSCGTAACLAGTAAIFALEPGHKIRNQNLIRPGLPNMHVSDAGREALGLTQYQAGALFYRLSAELDDIKLVASYIVGRDLTRVSA